MSEFVFVYRAPRGYRGSPAARTYASRGTTMTECRYAIYLHAGAEAVWRALTDPS